MRRTRILLTALDFGRLRTLVESFRLFLRPDWERADLLERELDRAEVVDNSMLPSGVIKMNYRVRVTDLTTSTQTVYTLVFPCEANASPSEVW